jgi:hypothetical protein
VYHNRQEGFHFLPPPEWKQQARAEFPSGPVTERRLLVEYKCFTSEKPAALDVSLVDLSENKSLTVFVQELGSEDNGQATGAVEEWRLSDLPAVRGVYVNRIGPEPTIREIVVVRRGGRAYVFTGVFAPGDTRSQEAIRKAIATLTW